MTYQYFSMGGVISRVFLDENSEPERCETYDPRIGDFKINNVILEDLYNHSDSMELTSEEFEKRLERAQKVS